MALEDFLLTLMEFQDLARNKVERWKIQLTLNGQPLGEEALEKVKQALVEPSEFWV